MADYHLYEVTKDATSGGYDRECPHGQWYESINHNVRVMCGDAYCRTICPFRGPTYTDDTKEPARVAVKCKHPEGMKDQTPRYGNGITTPHYSKGPAQDVTETFEK